MKLYQIKYFLALCETLNFTRAAEKCHVSQPSLTRAIQKLEQKLEQELGWLLIRRERRLTRLTELGDLVRPTLEQILVRSEQTKAIAERHLSHAKKPFNLGVMPSIGPVRLAPFLARFTRESPDTELRLFEAAASSLYDLLLGGNLDAAVVAYLDREDKRLRRLPLYKERLVCAMRRGHPLERREAVWLRDLIDENFLLRTNCENGELLLESCRRQGFEPRVAYRGAREDWVQAMVAAGRGITIMPEFSHCDLGIAARPLADPPLVRDL